MEATRQAPFARFGPVTPETPLVVSVPHAGRIYSPALLDAALLSAPTLAALEDRFADRLVADVPALGVATFVARQARAWIDLNRDERELDPGMIAPPPRADRLVSSAKVRGGLGLIPRRIAGAGDIWRRRLSFGEIEARLASDHRPWHAAIAAALASAHARFGIALLIDLHSMPPIARWSSGAAPHIVLGDRNGRSCALHIIERLEATARAEIAGVARNTPYAGGHTLERHGRPAAGIHAVQIEIDRSLYLAPDLRTPGPGMAQTTALVTRMVTAARYALAEMRPDPLALAAE